MAAHVAIDSGVFTGAVLLQVRRSVPQIFAGPILNVNVFGDYLAEGKTGGVMLSLKALAGDRYRVALEASAEIDPGAAERPWYFRIPGRRGHIFVHGPDTLGAWTDSVRIGRQLEQLPGVEVHQRGDRELAVKFPPSCLDAVAGVIRARRRRQVSEAERERLRRISGLPTVSAVSRAWDATAGDRPID